MPFAQFEFKVLPVWAAASDRAGLCFCFNQEVPAVPFKECVQLFRLCDDCQRGSVRPWEDLAGSLFEGVSPSWVVLYGSHGHNCVEVGAVHWWCNLWRAATQGKGVGLSMSGCSPRAVRCARNWSRWFENNSCLGVGARSVHDRTLVAPAPASGGVQVERTRGGALRLSRLSPTSRLDPADTLRTGGTGALQPTDSRIQRAAPPARAAAISSRRPTLIDGKVSCQRA